MSLFLHLSFFFWGRKYFKNHDTAALQLFCCNTIFCLRDPLLKLLYSLGSLNMLMTQTHGKIFYSRKCSMQKVDSGSCISSVSEELSAWPELIAAVCCLFSLTVGIMAVLQEARYLPRGVDTVM